MLIKSWNKMKNDLKDAKQLSGCLSERTHRLEGLLKTVNERISVLEQNPNKNSSAINFDDSIFKNKDGLYDFNAYLRKLIVSKDGGDTDED